MPSASALVAAGTTLGALLKKPPLDALEARMLAARVLGLSRVQLITQSEHRLTPAEAEQIAALFQRRIDGEPIAYILGEREFYGLALYTTPDVLIPRADTELLVDRALERLPAAGRVLDMGTGSGAIAVAIAHARPDAAVTALDTSTKALDVAHRNAQRHGVRVQLLQSDWYAELDAARQFDLIVANPPYIVPGDAHLSQGDLRFEPLEALTDDADGLQALRAIIRDAAVHLAPGAWLLVEHGYDQAAAVRALLERAGLREPQSWRDLAGIERVSGARH
jgi:release factor glutamine methyltransferase